MAWLNERNNIYIYIMHCINSTFFSEPLIFQTVFPVLLQVIVSGDILVFIIYIMCTFQSLYPISLKSSPIHATHRIWVRPIEGHLLATFPPANQNLAYRFWMRFIFLYLAWNPNFRKWLTRVYCFYDEHIMAPNGEKW